MRIQTDDLIRLTPESISMSDLARKLNRTVAGGTLQHLKERLIKEGIDFSHFKSRAWSAGVVFTNRRKTKDEILNTVKSRRTDTHLLRRALIESGVEVKCSECGLGAEWRGKPLVLEVDHIDGDKFNNKIDNIRFICPNCHTQTKNYKTKNMKGSKLESEE